MTNDLKKIFLYKISGEFVPANQPDASVMKPGE